MSSFTGCTDLFMGVRISRRQGGHDMCSQRSRRRVIKGHRGRGTDAKSAHDGIPQLHGSKRVQSSLQTTERLYNMGTVSPDKLHTSECGFLFAERDAMLVMPKDVQQKQIKGGPYSNGASVPTAGQQPSVITLSILLSPLHEAVSQCLSGTSNLTCIRGTSRATDAPNMLSTTSCTSCWICALGLVDAFCLQDACAVALVSCSFPAAGAALASGRAVRAM